jgi:hypothetical protein
MVFFCSRLDLNNHLFGFENDSHHADNYLDSHSKGVCSMIASYLIHATRLESFSVEREIYSCMHHGDWQRAGLPLPPKTFLSKWASDDQYSSCQRVLAMCYLTRFEAFCRIVCTNRSRMASSILVAAHVLQLRIHPTVASAVAGHLPMLTRAQQQLLLSTASCACHLARVLLMPSKVRYRFNKDPCKLLLQRMFDEVMVRRLVLLYWQ